MIVPTVKELSNSEGAYMNKVFSSVIAVLLVLTAVLLASCGSEEEQSPEATEASQATQEESHAISKMINVVATNGKTGWVYADDLEWAEAPAANPEEANKKMDKVARGESVKRAISVYDEDGETVIGEFVVE